MQPKRPPTVVDRARSEPVWDRQVTLTQIAGDESLLAEMAQLFIERSPVVLERVQDAVARRDAEALSQSAHALKGMVGRFAADKRRRLALE